MLSWYFVLCLRSSTRLWSRYRARHWAWTALARSRSPAARTHSIRWASATVKWSSSLTQARDRSTTNMRIQSKDQRQGTRVSGKTHSVVIAGSSRTSRNNGTWNRWWRIWKTKDWCSKHRSRPCLSLMGATRCSANFFSCFLRKQHTAKRPRLTLPLVTSSSSIWGSLGSSVGGKASSMADTKTVGTLQVLCYAVTLIFRLIHWLYIQLSTFMNHHRMLVGREWPLKTMSKRQNLLR